MTDATSLWGGRKVGREQETQGGGGWHLDKKVPIAFIFTLLLQTSFAVWWASSVNQRMIYIEAALGQRTQLEGEVQTLKTNIAVLQQDVLYMRRSLERIESAVTDRPAQRNQQPRGGGGE